MTKNLFNHQKYFGNDKFSLAGTSKTKKNAKARAERYRARGYKARIVQKNTGTPFKYAVYVKKQ